jgi:DNA-3-methyladenine glycosylase II
MKPEYWNKGKIYLSKNDKVLKNIIKLFSNENLELNPNHYHALLNSIIGQQISVLAANSIKTKFFSLHNKIVPNNVLKLDEISLKNCGLSKQKILYIKNISTFFLENKKFITNIHLYDEISIKDKLISIKGVGNWTADMFLLFSYGSSDIFPEGDLGFIKAISKFYKKKIPISNPHLKKLKKRWSPYSSIATWYLWRSLDPVPITY